MSIQNTNLELTNIQETILELEQHYFNLINNILTSQNFFNNLINLENKLNTNYNDIHDNYNVTNIVSLAAQRLVNYHIIHSLHNIITNSYASPISSDIAFETNNAIINIDIKTINVHPKANPGDSKSINVSPSQISFRHNNLFANGTTFPGFRVNARLPYLDNNKPVLTYIVQLIYIDNKTTFTFYRNTNRKNQCGTIQIACVPNGELSELFGNQIINNVKTYEYYKNEGYYSYKLINFAKNTLHQDWSADTIRYHLAGQHTPIPDSWTSISIPGKNRSSIIFYDNNHQTAWLVSNTKPYYTLKPIRSTTSLRLDIETLQNRFDANGNSWSGYITHVLP